MSALPDGVRVPNKVHQFIAKPIEDTDNAILSDSEVYELKGGDKVFAAKVVAGLAAAGLYLTLFGRFGQIKNFHISGK